MFNLMKTYSIMAHANNCTGYYGAYPNILLMDFVNIGYGLEAVAEMNGVPYNATSTTMTSGATRYALYRGEKGLMPLILTFFVILFGGALTTF